MNLSSKNNYNYEKVLASICKGLYEYIKTYRIKTLVLGLSGGLDSTVCAAICHLVVKDFNTTDNGFKVQLIGASLPCNSNSDKENMIADLAGSFCDKFVSTNLQKSYETVKNACEIATPSTDISQGNIKARLRMIYLYNLASTTGGIVIDTDNLTEHYLGFWTIHGDDGDLNPIGALWKTEVYALAKHLVSIYEKFDSWKHDSMVEALKHSIEITPTDGNGVKEGGDLAQIAPGYTYDDVDKVLMPYVNACEVPNSYQEPSEFYLKGLRQEIIDTYGYPADMVDGIIKRYKKSAYKRRHRPLVISLDGEILDKGNHGK